MNFLSPHKFWISTLLLASTLMFASAPLLDYFRNEASQHLAKIEAERTKAQQALQRLDDDIAMTKKLSGQIDAEEVEKSLANVDRLQAVDFLEKEAVTARLDHFAYTLSPEQKMMINEPGIGGEELAVSTIAVKADAALDKDVYMFVERIRLLMPGRLKLQSITLERMGTEEGPLTTSNLHMTASFEWLSNGTAKQVAEGK